MDLNYQYTKLRNSFGRQLLFCKRGPEMLDNITLDPTIYKQFILRNPVHQFTQNTENFSETTINTIRPEFVNTGVNHTEGGWAKDINVTDPEQTQRHRRKVEKEDGYQHCVYSLTPGFIHYVSQNNAINMYESYYRDMTQQPQLEKNIVRTINIYKDLVGKRPVGSISFQGDGGHKFAISHVDVDYYHKPKTHVTCYIWNLESAVEPEYKIIPPCTMCDFQFNPKDGRLLCGGLINGQVCAYDTRASLTPVAICSPHVAHRDVVKNVIYINSKSGQEFFSGSIDGSCRWWDIRNLEEPTDEMIIDVVKSANEIQHMENAMGVSVLEYEHTIPTRFMVGTENGYVVSGNRKGKSPMERLPLMHKGHDGPVLALERNPFFLKTFLTAGDWTVRIWSEDCKESSIIFTRPFRHKISHASWSPTKSSVFVMCQRNGQFSCWDLLKKQHEATVIMQICPEALLLTKPHELGGLVATGSETGNTYLIELSYNLQTSDKNDRNLFANSLERESRRERILEARIRELRLKLRQAEDASPKASEADIVPAGNWDLSTSKTEFFQTVKKELSQM